MPFYDRDKVQSAASGRWLELIKHLSSKDVMNALMKPGRHFECPVHGTSNRQGKGDGFRFFRDVAETGGGICNSCGSYNNGFTMLEWLNAWDFKTALKAVAEDLGVEPEPTQGNAREGNRGNRDRQQIIAKQKKPAATHGQVQSKRKVANGHIDEEYIPGAAPYWQEAVNAQQIAVHAERTGVSQEVCRPAKKKPTKPTPVKPEKVTPISQVDEGKTKPRNASNVVPLDALKNDPAIVELRKIQTAITEKNQQNIVDIDRKVQKVWRDSFSLDSAHAAPVRKYFQNRKLTIRDKLYCSDTLRAHPALEYYETGEDNNVKLIGKFPALMAAIRDVDGNISTLHRIYLTPRGFKANVDSPKKMMEVAIDKRVTGGAIRLGGEPVDGVLGVAEGIETSIACFNATGIPVWSTVSATIMEKFELPPGVHTVLIWADKDRSLTGEVSAMALKDRLVAMGIRVIILLPRLPIKALEKSVDWADVMKEQGVLGFPRMAHLKKYIFPNSSQSAAVLNNH